MVHYLVPVGVLLAGVAIFFALLGTKEVPSARAHAPNAETTVQTVAARRHTGPLVIKVDGLAVPFREVRIAAEVAGRITVKSDDCRAGKFVEKGATLIEIDPRDYDLEVRRLEKEVAQAENALAQLQVEQSNTDKLIALAVEDWRLQKKELDRIVSLANRKIVTDTDLDQAKRNELAARNSHRTLHNQLQLIESRRVGLERAKELIAAKLEQAQLDRRRATIKAPLDGMVVSDQVEKDSYVQKGTSLVTIEDTSAVEVKCNLRMGELYWIWRQKQPQGDAPAKQPSAARRDYQIPRCPVTILYELAGRQYSWQGVLSRYDSIGLNEKTRTVACRVLVDQPRRVRVKQGEKWVSAEKGPPALVRGMYVGVHIHTTPDVPLLAMPAQAVRPGNVVWTVRDGKLAKHHVRVVEVLDHQVLVHAEAEGLSAGDAVVVSPLASAVEGTPVTALRQSSADEDDASADPTRSPAKPPTEPNQP